jgi:hypothetical protein
MTYKKTLMRILDRKDQVLRNKNISLVKVLWSDYSVEEGSWKLEESMRNCSAPNFNSLILKIFI